MHSDAIAMQALHIESEVNGLDSQATNMYNQSVLLTKGQAMRSLLFAALISVSSAYLVMNGIVEPKAIVGLGMLGIMFFAFAVMGYGYRAFAGISTSYRQGERMMRTSPGGSARMAWLNRILLRVTLIAMGTVLAMAYFGWVPD